MTKMAKINTFSYDQNFWQIIAVSNSYMLLFINRFSSRYYICGFDKPGSKKR